MRDARNAAARVVGAGTDRGETKDKHAEYTPAHMPCSRHGIGCPKSLALARELDDAGTFALYRNKLPIRGWGGSMSPIEKSFARAHRTSSTLALSMRYSQAEAPKVAQ